MSCNWVELAGPLLLRRKFSVSHSLSLRNMWSAHVQVGSSTRFSTCYINQAILCLHVLRLLSCVFSLLASLSSCSIIGLPLSALAVCLRFSRIFRSCYGTGELCRHPPWGCLPLGFVPPFFFVVSFIGHVQLDWFPSGQRISLSHAAFSQKNHSGFHGTS